MNVIDIDIDKLVPYRSNPRNNKDAIDYVVASIKEFGFKVPIVVDKENEIVCGHTRYEAAIKLGYRQIPCVIADDLSEEQVKAFRLADNKVSEIATWDFDLLDLELSEVEGIDMEDFGFEFEVESDDPMEEQGEKENERLRTDSAYNLPFVDIDRCEGKYQMPMIEPVNHIPESLIGFNYALSSTNKDTGVHFYVDDYQFERVWNNPEKYIEVLYPYACVLTPDFSLYLDMPISMKIWNVFRSRLIGQMCQDAGLTVIPTVSWAEEATFEFCFDGLPENSVLSVSTIGVKRSTEAMKIWKAGMDELIKRKKPRALLVYGGEVEYDYGNIKVYYFANQVTENMKIGV